MNTDADLAILRIPLFLFVCTSLMTNNLKKLDNKQTF